MAAITGSEVIVDAAILGLLVGIIWGLRYLVTLERKVESMEKKILAAINKK